VDYRKLYNAYLKYKVYDKRKIDYDNLENALSKNTLECIIKRKKIRSNMENILIEYAKNYEVAPDTAMHLLAESHASAYLFHGSKCNIYAKNALLLKVALLIGLNFNAEIREITDEPQILVKRWGISINEYQLWANLTGFDYWMINHQNFGLTVLEWAVLLWRRNIDPRVYNQCLEKNMVERARKLAMNEKYKIFLNNGKEIV
jgi:hypothetical protein